MGGNPPVGIPMGFPSHPNGQPMRMSSYINSDMTAFSLASTSRSGLMSTDVISSGLMFVDGNKFILTLVLMVAMELASLILPMIALMYSSCLLHLYMIGSGGSSRPKRTCSNLAPSRVLLSRQVSQIFRFVFASIIRIGGQTYNVERALSYVYNELHTAFEFVPRPYPDRGEEQLHVQEPLHRRVGMHRSHDVRAVPREDGLVDEDVAGHVLVYTYQHRLVLDLLHVTNIVPKSPDRLPENPSDSAEPTPEATEESRATETPQARQPWQSIPIGKVPTTSDFNLIFGGKRFFILEGPSQDPRSRASPSTYDNAVSGELPLGPESPFNPRKPSDPGKHQQSEWQTPLLAHLGPANSEGIQQRPKKSKKCCFPLRKYKHYSKSSSKQFKPLSPHINATAKSDSIINMNIILIMDANTYDNMTTTTNESNLHEDGPDLDRWRRWWLMNVVRFTTMVLFSSTQMPRLMTLFMLLAMDIFSGFCM
ncbi:hypothetical protein CDV55_100721 [Aspergillus turcosus]|nr:hypothetical protein CDV55_100721 [Aspergillus turcosus]